MTKKTNWNLFVGTFREGNSTVILYVVRGTLLALVLACRLNAACSGDTDAVRPPLYAREPSAGKNLSFLMSAAGAKSNGLTCNRERLAHHISDAITAESGYHTRDFSET